MPQRHKMEVGGLNIRAHPHSEETYRDLIYRMYGLKAIIKVRGERSGLITSIDRRDDRSEIIRGIITTFLNVDIEGGWFNVETMQDATDEDIDAIFIPPNLRPNSRAFRFEFDPIRHLVTFEHYVEGDRMTHNTAQIFFERLSSRRAIIDRFGDIKVTIIQSRGSIDKIFSIPRITDISIYIEKPNADLWGGNFEELAEEHLEDKNARSMRVDYKAEQGLGIERDEDLDALIAASINNGEAVAKGYGPEGHVKVSTKAYPKVIQEKYEPEVATSVMFERLSRIFRAR